MGIKDAPGLKNFVTKGGLRYLVIIAVIFGVGVLLSVLSWRQQVHDANTALLTQYQQQLNQSKSILVQSLNQYSLLLDDGTSLLKVTGSDTTQDQWLTFFQSYGLPRNYAGVDAVSYSTYVPGSGLSDFLAKQTAQGRSDFKLTPAGDRPAYAPITYIGYVSPNSLKAMGYDQLNDPVRGAAITRALRSGQVTMSGKVNLVAVHKNESAFIIFKPVYDGPAGTEAERAASIKGFAFIAINSQDFFSRLLAPYVPPDIAVQIYDDSIARDNLLYETKDFDQAVKDIPNPIDSTINVNFGGRTWDIKIVTAKGLLLTSPGQASNARLLTGIGISALLAAILWYFTYYRERKIYWQKQNELQAAKDELLSLASHQLRTPATIVKQYLGILLQNYGGNITEQQRHIVQTAYDSNERQLEIANQFLEAAKLGSGRIAMHSQTVVLNDLIDTVVAEQRKIARERRQQIIYTKPKRVYRVKGDPKYLPMVFENLINNAIKYSKRNTKITVSLRKSEGRIVVSVKDQGIGIAAQELPTLFEKFSQASNRQSDGGNSTGIGLYLAQQITNLHGGYISVESVVGKGSQFNVSLPLRR